VTISRLNATNVRYESPSELGVLTVSFQFGGDPGLPSELILQRALEFDEQDVQLRMNTYCLTNHAQATVYGGVERYCFVDHGMALELRGDAATALGLSTQVVVDIIGRALGPSAIREMASLKEAVRQILKEAQETDGLDWLG
jgi:hypothetical protein